MAKDLAIVLNNGSVNSTVTTALAAQRCRVVLVHVLDGSAERGGEPPSRGRVAFDQQVSHFKPFREHVISIPLPAHFGGGAPAGAPAPGEAAGHPSGVERKLIDLLPVMAIGARLAVQHGASSVHLGLRVGPNPDVLARATEYLQVWGELLQLPCGVAELDFAAPLLELEAWQTVDLGFQVSAPLERTWSCEQNGNDPCWACPTCRSREQAFQQSGKPDPIRPARR